MNVLRLFLAYSLICLLSACNKEESKISTFATLEPVKSSFSGIEFKNTLSDDPLSNRNLLSYEYYFNGAGVGIGDFNKDGLQDIFFAGNEVPNEIYINKGEFKFEKLEDNSSINQNKYWSAGVSVVDINNDGYHDIYISQQGPVEANERKNIFFINNKDLTFTEAAASFGLDDSNISTQASFFDYDKDGDLDCFVLNESIYSRTSIPDIQKAIKDKNNLRASSCRLYENKGNLVFEDVTEKAGLLRYGFGLGLNISDINGDNWPDIYVANDYHVPDFMYINQKNGTFKESIKEYTRQISYFGMGCDIADINNDGLLDIGVVDMAAEDHFRDKTLMAGMDSEAFKFLFYNLEFQYQYMFNSLQLNNGNNTFSNIAAMSGVLKSDWSWGALFVDLNLDGYKDYYVTNGYRRYGRDNDFRIKLAQTRKENNGTVPMSMREEIYNLMPAIQLANKLYINDGDLGFDDDSELLKSPDDKTFSYGVAYADFDNDGDFDLVINNIDQEATLLRNTTREKLNNNYLKIVLDHPNPAKKLTSKVYLFAGDEIQIQEYQFVRGYESTMEESLIFGLGTNKNIDSLKIVWADGNAQTISNPGINQTLKVPYAAGKQWAQTQNTSGLFNQLSTELTGIEFSHRENYFDDFEKEVLLPQKQTSFGPAIAAADVNKDGLEDFFIGGAKGQAGTLYLQNPDGSFKELNPNFQAWKNDAAMEDVSAVFIDPNNDGNPDLYVGSGGSGDVVGEEVLLQDRFYANLGGGKFGRIGNVLPELLKATYSVINVNIDDDPEDELIVIGAAKPGRYPMKESSLILDYDNNRYLDKTNTLIPELNNINGLIRDCSVADIDGDGDKDIITVGEWQSINVFLNEGNKWTLSSTPWVPDYKEGWYRSIEKADLDGDGDVDFIVGNVGKNFKQKATKDYPLYLYSSDFDENGTLDIVLAKPYNDKIVPTRGRQCSSEQMPFIKDKFETYKAFASAGIEDILGENNIKEGINLKAHNFYSIVLWNENGKFKADKLPMLAQMSPVNDILIKDFDGDGLEDVFVVGNDYNTEYETPRLDAGNGLILINKGDRTFKALSVNESGIFNPGDAKKAIMINEKESPLIIVANNNSKPNVFKKNINVQ